jgi:thioredoxin reductase (NADPH)
MDAAIIGGGPAGIAAAIQLHRQGRRFVLYEQEAVGGLLLQAGWIENYPGFPAGIKGEKLAGLFREQLSRLPADVRMEEIASLDYDPGIRRFSLFSARGRSSAAQVVVASGTKPRGLPFPMPLSERLLSRVFFDWRKIPAQGGSRVVIIGAGDIALDYALSLKPEHKVVVLCRGKESRALPLLQQRVRETRAIELLFQTVITGLTGGDSPPFLRLSGNKAGTPFELGADYILSSVGREARKDFFSPRLIRLEDELIGAGSLVLAGDVKNDTRRQIGLAVGDGLAAAMVLAGRPPAEPR